MPKTFKLHISIENHETTILLLAGERQRATKKHICIVGAAQTTLPRSATQLRPSKVRGARNVFGRWYAMSLQGGYQVGEFNIRR